MQIIVFLYFFFSLQVVEVDVKVEEPGNNNVHNNAFYAEEKLLKSELQAMRDCNPLSARHWIVRLYIHAKDFLIDTLIDLEVNA